MTMQLGEPISIEGKSFEPRIVGQTTLFPLEDELQELMETTFQRAIQINKTSSFTYKGNAQYKVTGFIHEWTKYEHDEYFRGNATKLLSAFKSRLAPYIEGLELNALTALSNMRYEAQHGDVKYRLVFRISDKSTYLIASPALECTLPKSSAIRPALEMGFASVYERILDYVFNGKKLDRDCVEHVQVKPWGYEFALKPVLVGDIPSVAAELSDAAKEMEAHSEKIHQAASLISLANEGGKMSRRLEKKLDDNPAVAEPRRLAEERIYREARALLDTVEIGETPTLNKYFV